MKMQDLPNLKIGHELKCSKCGKTIKHGIDEIHYLSDPMIGKGDEVLEDFSDEINPVCDECFKS